MPSEIADVEPPLLKGFNEAGDISTHGLLHNLIVFIKVLIWRMASYVMGVMNAFGFLFGVIARVGVDFKRFMIRLLMYRGGYFYQTPRLGLAAVTSTTVFSMLLLPVLDPLGDTHSLTKILAQTQAEETTQPFVFFDSVRSNKVLAAQDLESEVMDYAVESGDTLISIAEAHLVTTEAIKYVNKMKDDVIHPGDILKIPPVNGLVHVVDTDETISSIADIYQVPPQAIVDFNHIEEPYVIHKDEELLIPDAKIPAPKATAPVMAAAPAGLVLQPAAPAQSGTGGFVMPTNGVITQYFWWGHTAIDVASACGTPIVAADSGTITFAGWWDGGGGNSVFVDHGNGYVTKYAHMSGFARTSGGVNRGDVIGYVGQTGRAFGCHVHFIVNQGGRAINPLSVL